MFPKPFTVVYPLQTFTPPAAVEHGRVQLQFEVAVSNRRNKFFTLCRDSCSLKGRWYQDHQEKCQLNTHRPLSEAPISQGDLQLLLLYGWHAENVNHCDDTGSCLFPTSPYFHPNWQTCKQNHCYEPAHLLVGGNKSNYISIWKYLTDLPLLLCWTGCWSFCRVYTTRSIVSCLWA